MDTEVLVATIREHARAEHVRLTWHAQDEMVEDGISIDEVLEALAGCRMLEN